MRVCLFYSIVTMKATIRAMLTNSMRSSGHIVLRALTLQGSLRCGFANHSTRFHEFQYFLLVPSHSVK